MVKRLFYYLCAFAFVFFLISCGDSKNKTSSKESYVPVGADVKRVDEIKLSDDVELEEIKIDNPDQFCNTYKDVEPNFSVVVGINSSYLSDANLEDDIVVHHCNEDEETIELNIKSQNDSNGTFFLVSAKNGFERGEAYTIDINKNENMFFKDKDYSIRTVLFNVKEDNKNDCSTKEYNNYDLNKVSHFEGYGDYNTYLYYDGTINEAAGDIITFSNDTDKLYIKIKQKSSENGLTKIFYECPKADEIFNELDLHIDDKELDMENDFVLNDLNLLANDILQSDFVLIHCYAVADSYGFAPAINKFLDSANVSVSFTPKGNQIDLGVQISYTFEFESGWRLCLCLKFLWTKTFNASADAELETFLGIPIGIKMNTAVSSDERFTFEFLVTFKSSKLNPGYVPDSPKDLDLSRAKRAVEELKDKWGDADVLGYKNDKIVGDTMMLNIGHFSVYFGYVSIDLDIYLCMKLDCNVTIGAAYTYATHQVMVNYSSSGGNGDGGVSPSEVSAKTINASIAGTLSTELFLRIRVTVYITGLKFLANISVDVDAGVYLTVNGLGSVAYNFTTDELNADSASSIEFGFFFRVNLNISLLFIINGNWTLYEAKAPVLKLGWSYGVKERTSTETLELNKQVTLIKDTNLLTFNVFDSNGMSMLTKTFAWDEKVTYLDSLFISNPLSYKLFGSFSASSQYVTIEEGRIIVDSRVPEVSGNITFRKYTTGSDYETVIVPFHYLSKDAKFVSFDGNNKKAYLPGEVIEFPSSVEVKDGYIFKGWEYNGNIYNSLAYFEMIDQDINFTSVYIKNEYYTVKFYDGLGNLISTQMVLNGNSAVEPDKTLRDLNMDGYNFLRWDQKFDCVTGDLEVYAIYERVGDII